MIIPGMISWNFTATPSDDKMDQTTFKSHFDFTTCQRTINIKERLPIRKSITRQRLNNTRIRIHIDVVESFEKDCSQCDGVVGLLNGASIL